LPASIVAGAKLAGGTTWALGTALEIFLDVQNMYKQAQTQMLGNVNLKSKMTLAISPLSEVNLTKVVPTYGTMSVADLIKKTFPEHGNQDGCRVQHRLRPVRAIDLPV